MFIPRLCSVQSFKIKRQVKGSRGRHCPLSLRSVTLGLLAVLVGLTSQQNTPAQTSASPPKELNDITAYAPLVWPDGSVEYFYNEGEYGRQKLMRVRSREQRKSWTEPQEVFALPSEGKWFKRSALP